MRLYIVIYDLYSIHTYQVHQWCFLIGQLLIKGGVSLVPRWRSLGTRLGWCRINVYLSLGKFTM